MKVKVERLELDSDFKKVNSVALGLAAKKEIVAEINEVASRALSVAVADNLC
jgi:large subunit ribosomal protein L10